MPSLKGLFALLGVDFGYAPINLSLVLALLCCVGMWLFVWRSRIGYELRVVGHSEAAAVYGGISPANRIILAMTISGALAGLMATNEILGGQHRIILGFSGGYGFAGIAVALMGRNHPVGIVLAALLFGALYQGGTELAFEMPRVNKDLVVVIQGLVILFAGALENMFRPQLEALFARRRPHGGARLMPGEVAFQLLLMLDSTIRLAAPLVLAAMAGLFCERSGVVDIALEGKMLGAAFAAAAVAQVTGSAWLGVLAGMAFGVCLALVHGFASITHRGDQVVSGMALNVIAAGPGAHARRRLVPPGRPRPGHRRGRPLRADRPALRRGVRAGADPGADLRRPDQRPQRPGLPHRRSSCRWSPGWSTAPASACACAPWAKTRPRSTRPASRSPACATGR